MATAYAAPVLMGLYGDVEHTGFYEKLTHRYNITSVLVYLWDQPSHREAFIAASKDESRFLAFANGIIGHSNHLLSESLMKLESIRTTQLKQRNPDEWAALSEDDRRQELETLQEDENIAEHSLRLANQTVAVLEKVTQCIHEPFLAPEVLTPLANMLAEILQRLGTRGLSIKVDAPEKYNFRPVEMMKQTLHILLNLSGLPAFVTAVADTRNVSAELFDRIQRIARRRAMLTPTNSEAFAAFAADVVRVLEGLLSAEEALGEAPDEFLDELMGTVMSDPVRLPSDHIVDRSTLAQHLLNSETDPYTRLPLSMDEVEPQVELRKRIEAWRARSAPREET